MGEPLAHGSGTEDYREWGDISWCPASAGLHPHPVLLNIFLNGLDTELKGMLSNCAKDPSLGGAVPSLEGKEALQRPQQIKRDEQSPTT